MPIPLIASCNPILRNIRSSLQLRWQIAYSRGELTSTSSDCFRRREIWRHSWLIGALISGNAPAQQVTLTGVNWTINYNGATSGYFGPSPQSLCSACPLTFRAGERFTYTLQLQSSASFLTHSVDSVSIAFPFTLISTSPSLPISVSPGGTARVTFTIEVPSQGGSYVMSATINTT